MNMKWILMQTLRRLAVLSVWPFALALVQSNGAISSLLKS
jgi:hypothetical protein